MQAFFYHKSNYKTKANPYTAEVYNYQLNDTESTGYTASNSNPATAKFIVLNENLPSDLLEISSVAGADNYTDYVCEIKENNLIIFSGIVKYNGSEKWIPNAKNELSIIVADFTALFKIATKAELASQVWRGFIFNDGTNLVNYEDSGIDFAGRPSGSFRVETAEQHLDYLHRLADFNYFNRSDNMALDYNPVVEYEIDTDSIQNSNIVIEKEIISFTASNLISKIDQPSWEDGHIQVGISWHANKKDPQTGTVVMPTNFDIIVLLAKRTDQGSDFSTSVTKSRIYGLDSDLNIVDGGLYNNDFETKDKGSFIGFIKNKIKYTSTDKGPTSVYGSNYRENLEKILPYSNTVNSYFLVVKSEPASQNGFDYFANDCFLDLEYNYNISGDDSSTAKIIKNKDIQNGLYESVFYYALATPDGGVVSVQAPPVSVGSIPPAISIIKQDKELECSFQEFTNENNQNDVIFRVTGKTKITEASKYFLKDAYQSNNEGIIESNLKNQNFDTWESEYKSKIENADPRSDEAVLLRFDYEVMPYPAVNNYEYKGDGKGLKFGDHLSWLTSITKTIVTTKNNKVYFDFFTLKTESVKLEDNQVFDLTKSFKITKTEKPKTITNALQSVIDTVFSAEPQGRNKYTFGLQDIVLNKGDVVNLNVSGSGIRAKITKVTQDNIYTDLYTYSAEGVE